MKHVVIPLGLALLLMGCSGNRTIGQRMRDAGEVMQNHDKRTQQDTSTRNCTTRETLKGQYETICQ